MTTPYKTCPKCGQNAVLSIAQCRRCGYQFQPIQPPTASQAKIRFSQQPTKFTTRHMASALLAIVAIIAIGFFLTVARGSHNSSLLHSVREDAWNFVIEQVQKDIRGTPSRVDFPHFNPEFVISRGTGSFESHGIEEFIVSGSADATYSSLNAVVLRRLFAYVVQHDVTGSDSWRLKDSRIMRGYYINPTDVPPDTDLPTAGVVVFRENLPLASDAATSVVASQKFTAGGYSSELQRSTSIGNEGTVAVKLAETSDALQVRILAVPEDEGGPTASVRENGDLRIPIGSTWWVSKHDVDEHQQGHNPPGDGMQNPTDATRYLPGIDGPVVR